MIKLDNDLGNIAQVYVGRSAGGNSGNLFLTAPTNKNVIFDEGNVGIGTTSPGYKLDVVGHIRLSGGIESPNSEIGVNQNSGPRAYFSTRGTNIGLSNTAPTYGVIESGATYDLHFNIDGSEKMTILDNGNVGIGTTAPAQKLTVAGTIESTTGGIKFPDGSTQTTATRYKVGAFTRDLTLAAGTQAVTGVGFAPQAIFFMASVGGVPGRTSWGISDGTTSRALFDHHPTYADSFNLTAIPIYLVESPGVDSYGALSSFDSDGFTISWTKAGSPTGTATIFYIAFK